MAADSMSSTETTLTLNQLREWLEQEYTRCSLRQDDFGRADDRAKNYGRAKLASDVLDIIESGRLPND